MTEQQALNYIAELINNNGEHITGEAALIIIGRIKVILEQVNKQE